MDWSLLALPGLFIWVSILALPWRPWSTRESLDAYPRNQDLDLTEITVLIPARNEAAVIADTLIALARIEDMLLDRDVLEPLSGRESAAKLALPDDHLLVGLRRQRPQVSPESKTFQILKLSMASLCLRVGAANYGHWSRAVGW